MSKRASRDGLEKEGKPKVITAAMEWMSSAGDADNELVALLKSLPLGVLNQVRLVGVGHGKRVRDCLLCECSCLSTDPI